MIELNTDSRVCAAVGVAYRSALLSCGTRECGTRQSDQLDVLRIRRKQGFLGSYLAHEARACSETIRVAASARASASDSAEEILVTITVPIPFRRPAERSATSSKPSYLTTDPAIGTLLSCLAIRPPIVSTSSSSSFRPKRSPSSSTGSREETR